MDDPNFPVKLSNNDEEVEQPSSPVEEDVIESKPSYDLKQISTDPAESPESTIPRSGANLATAGYPVPVGDVFCWKHSSSITNFFWLTLKFFAVNRPQILSGITVALAQVPEAVSFSFVAGVDPIVGLQSAWIMGLMTSLFGGRPGMVAGATGAIAIVLPKLVETKGVGYMFYAIMLAGIIQIIFSFLKLGVLVRMIPHPVMVGFCNGLGVVIGVAQFNIFKERPVEVDGEDVARRLVELGGAFAPFTNGWDWVDATEGGWMAFHIIVALLTYAFFPKIPYIGRAIPASLASIIVTTILEAALVRPIGYETKRVSDMASVKGSFPIPVWFTEEYRDLMPPLNGETFAAILPVSFTAAAIGLLESLLTLEIIDEMTNTKGNNNREAFGQGLGNLLSGLLGGMGGCTTIGQSMMNLHSGGYTRLSSSVAAIFMLIIILAAYPLINLIPVAGLAGVMFIVTYFTIEWESFKIVFGSILPQKYRLKYNIETKVKRSDVFIMLAVVAVTLLLDLAIGVAVGIVISCLVYAWDTGTKITFNRAVSEDGHSVLYSVGGQIFFGSIKPLMDAFPDPAHEPKDVTILLEHADIADWSGMMAIKRIHDKLEANGAKVKFQKLNVSSRKMMQKSKHLWEGVNVFEEEEVNVESDPLVERSHREELHL